MAAHRQGLYLKEQAGAPVTGLSGEMQKQFNIPPQLLPERPSQSPSPAPPPDPVRILGQISDWLGLGHLLGCGPVTVVGWLQSPDWPALGHVPQYIPQYHLG